MHIVCPHCYAINNIPESKEHTQANCGKCQQKLHTHQPCQLTQGQFYRYIERNHLPVLVDFWASWCGPCIQEMPALDKLATKYQPLGVQIWGVNVEADSSAAQKYLSKTRVEFPILFDTENSVSASYQVQAMPTTVIINQDGEVHSVHRGYKPGYEQKYENDIKTLLRN